MSACLAWGLTIVAFGSALPGGGSLPRGADAPVSLFITPDAAPAAAGGRLGLHLERGGVGAGGAREGVDWAGVPATWFFVRSGGTQENRDTPAEFIAAAEPMVAAVPVARAGVVMIGLEAAPRVEVVDGEAWREFVEAWAEPGAAAALIAGIGADGVVRVRRVESAKLVVRVPGEAGVVDEQTASSKSGQVSEIRLLMDATSLPIPSDIQVRAYADSGASGGARVRAARDGGREVQMVTVDKHGIGIVHLTEPGRWRVETHRARALPPGEDADVVLFTATLVVDVPGAGEAEEE